MSDSGQRVSRAVFVLLVLAGLGTGTLAFRQIAREARAIISPPTPPLPKLGQVPAFALTSQHGTPLSLADLNGNVWLADFVFTRCAGPCPRMTRRMADLQRELADEPNLRFVSFSVDPGYDTPPVLQRYADLFEADSATWFFLTGDRTAIYNLSIKGFKLAVEDGDDPEYESIIIHSTRFVLVDPKGGIRGYYDEEDPQAMEQLVTDITQLIAARADE